MTALIYDDFRIQSAQQFLRSVDGDDSYYLVLGRTRSWTDENNPDVPLDSTESIYADWMDFLAARKIAPGDVSLGILRNNWVADTAYDKYRHDISPANPAGVSGATSLFESSFYVVNSELNVYKCIDNANGAPSTVEPTGTGTIIQELSDGYAWKFMYGLTSLQSLRFIAPDYIIVKTIESDDGTGQWQVQQNAVDGAIDHIHIENGGSGYTSANTTVTVEGDGSGISAEVQSSDLDGNGSIQSITINDPGSGYNYAKVTISGDGSNAEAKAIISPRGGHGADAVRELGGFNLFINIQIEGDAGEFFVRNDFRSISILANPLNQSGNVALDSSARLTKTLTLSGISGSFVANDTIQGDTSGAEGHVVQNRDPGVDFVKTIENIVPEFDVGETVSSSSGGTATIDAIDEPAFQQFTGHMLYHENRRPIIRAEDQQEDIKLIIEW